MLKAETVKHMTWERIKNEELLYLLVTIESNKENLGIIYYRKQIIHQHKKILVKSQATLDVRIFGVDIYLCPYSEFFDWIIMAK